MKGHLGRVVAFDYIGCSDALKGLAESPAGVLFGEGGVGQDDAAAEEARAVWVGEGDGHDCVAAPEVDAGGEAGDGVARPTALGKGEIGVPEDDAIAAGGEGGGEFERGLAAGGEALIGQEGIDQDEDVGRRELRALELAGNGGDAVILYDAGIELGDLGAQAGSALGVDVAEDVAGPAPEGAGGQQGGARVDTGHVAQGLEIDAVLKVWIGRGMFQEVQDAVPACRGLGEGIGGGSGVGFPIVAGWIVL